MQISIFANGERKILKTVIVHIGVPKTGSTSIQISLRKSKELLKSQGILYFTETRTGIQPLSMAFHTRKKPAVRAGLSISEMKKASYSSWISLSRRVRSENIAYTVISEEFFSRLPQPERLKKILDQIFDRVVIIAYIRSPALRFPSSIDQRIRTGLTLKEVIAGRGGMPRNFPVLEKYANVFGKSNLIVRNFDRRNLKNGSLICDFSNSLSKATDRHIDLLDVGHVNPSVPASVTSFLLGENQKCVLNGQLLDTEWFRRRRHLVNAIRKNPSLMNGEKLRLNDPVISGHIWNFFADEVTSINERFLSDQIGIGVEKPGELLSVVQLRTAVARWINQHENASVNEALKKLSNEQGLNT